MWVSQQTTKTLRKIAQIFSASHKKIFIISIIKKGENQINAKRSCWKNSGRWKKKFFALQYYEININFRNRFIYKLILFIQSLLLTHKMYAKNFFKIANKLISI